MKPIIITYPLYIRKVKLSDKRMAIYYEKEKKEPKAKKFQNKKYQWQTFMKGRLKGRTFLIDTKTGDRVVSNPIAAGTPKWQVINGQSMYNGSIKEFSRATIMSEIKVFLGSPMDKVPYIDVPINIVMEIHDTVYEFSQLWDVDNRSFLYVKGFLDCLTGNKDKEGNLQNKKVIQDDANIFIPCPPAPKFIAVEKPEDRKLVYIINEETDPRIVNKLLKDARENYKLAN